MPPEQVRSSRSCQQLSPWTEVDIPAQGSLGASLRGAGGYSVAGLSRGERGYQGSESRPATGWIFRADTWREGIHHEGLNLNYKALKTRVFLMWRVAKGFKRMRQPADRSSKLEWTSPFGLPNSNPAIVLGCLIPLRFRRICLLHRIGASQANQYERPDTCKFPIPMPLKRPMRVRRYTPGATPSKVSSTTCCTTWSGEHSTAAISCACPKKHRAHLRQAKSVTPCRSCVEKA